MKKGKQGKDCTTRAKDGVREDRVSRKSDKLTKRQDDRVAERNSYDHCLEGQDERLVGALWEDFGGEKTTRTR